MRHAHAGDHRLRSRPRRRDGPPARPGQPRAGARRPSRPWPETRRWRRSRPTRSGCSTWRARTHIPVAAGADRAADPPRPGGRARSTARPGLDGPDLPPPSREPEPIHAVELIARKLRERPHTLIPIGPLTNIALLLALHPELTDRIERIVLMGGAIGLGNVTPSAEFNIWCDPEAAHRVFTSGVDVTMVGLDVTHRAMLSAARAEALREHGSRRRGGRRPARVLPAVPPRGLWA